MEAQEKKITERDMKFLTTYANTYFPLHDLLPDYGEAIRATEGFDKAHDILVKEKEAIKKKLTKSRERLQKLQKKYGCKRVMDIVSDYDGYSN